VNKKNNTRRQLSAENLRKTLMLREQDRRIGSSFFLSALKMVQLGS
jgi:hypothetical protein